MQKVICAICKSNKRIEVLFPSTIDKIKLSEKLYTARRNPDRIHHQFVKCTSCSLIFSSPIIPPEQIKNLYKKSDFTFKKETENLKKTYIEYLKSTVNKDALKSIRLLEIGCSNGFFLEEAQKMGIKHVYGVEPSINSVKNAIPSIKKNIKTNFFKKGLFKNNTFDIICCFHTLDHILNIDEFLKTTYALLRKNGKILFIVHDTNGLSVKIFGENSPIFDIEHIFLFNKITLKKLFSLYDFKKIKIFPVKNTFSLSYITHLIPLSKKLRFVLFKFLYITKLNNFSLSLKLGNIGIVAEKDN